MLEAREEENALQVQLIAKLQEEIKVHNYANLAHAEDGMCIVAIDRAKRLVKKKFWK